MRRVSFALAAIVWLHTAHPSVVLASPDVVARVQALAAEGEAAFQAERYEAALSAYAEAHGLLALPELSFMVGRSLELLGRLPAALAAFERALGEGPEADLRGRAEQKVADLRVRVRSFRLILLVEPSGAAVSVAGRLVGRAPVAPLVLPVGACDVQVLCRVSALRA